MADLTKVCKDCGASFVITEDNKKWFEDRQLQIPERCEACRKKRKNAKKTGGK